MYESTVSATVVMTLPSPLENSNPSPGNLQLVSKQQAVLGPSFPSSNAGNDEELLGIDSVSAGETANARLWHNRAIYGRSDPPT